MLNVPNHNSPVYLTTKGNLGNFASYSQEELLNFIDHFSPESQRLLSTLFKNSKIEYRHSIFNTLLDIKAEQNLKKISILSTAERNTLYRQTAPKVFKDAAINLFHELDNFKVSDITHVITASCTGCYSPGPSDELIHSLNLEPTTERIHIGYMGCYAGLAAIRVAESICRANLNANVLIVCVEISSLHWNKSESEDNMLSLSLFGDGSGAAILSSKKFKRSFELILTGTTLIPDSDQEMAWNMGECGFEMTLSRSVPNLIKNNLEKSLKNITSVAKIDLNCIDYWAVHPGGAKILKTIEQVFHLGPKQISASYETLNSFGNMSSATIMFVLEKILLQADQNENVLALAFGPGLTIEKTLLKVSA